MIYHSRSDYRDMVARVRDTDPRATVLLHESPKGGYVINVKVHEVHIRIAAKDADDCFAAADAALSEVNHER